MEESPFRFVSLTMCVPDSVPSVLLSAGIYLINDRTQGFITLVLQEELEEQGGGLEIWDHQAEAAGAEADWLRVPPVPDSIVVNVGDYLSLLSGAF